MQLMMTCSSHSPLYYFPFRESESYTAVREAIDTQRLAIQSFDPDVVLFLGNDHYGGQQMYSMPAFCVGVEATALSDVGGTPGNLRVPRDKAVQLVNDLRDNDIDVAVSYNMTVDHGFSFALKELTGSIDQYPVIPVFVNCIQPPFVPFKRARKLGEALGELIKQLPYERVLIMGTGGLSHDPEFLFPAIDDVSEEWKPYILNGNLQSDVPQQAWIDYEIKAHKDGAAMVADENLPLEKLGIIPEWDDEFLAIYCSGDFEYFDRWRPADVVARPGIGAMEILTWIAAGAAMKSASNVNPVTKFYNPCREIAVGFSISQAGPAALI